MEPQSCSGQMYGMTTFFHTDSQDYSFGKNKSILVAQFLHNNQIEQQFHVPLSVQAFQEYQAMQDIIQQIQISPVERDSWKYISANYTSFKFYNLLYKNVQHPRPFTWIWNFSCSNKVRVFTWLLLMDRFNVRNILRRKKHKLEGNNYNCVLCSENREETTFHLFFSCPFSQDCWRYLNINWNFNLDFYSMMDDARHHFTSNFFMEVFMIAAWLIWKQRNDFIFNRGRPAFQQWKTGFLEEASLQAHRMNVSKKGDLISFLHLFS
jgi:hypothetical protein